MWPIFISYNIITKKRGLSVYNQSMGFLGSSGIERWRLFSSILTTGSIYSVAISSSGDIYVGGLFSAINGVPANNIAVYSGGNWYPLGSGCNSSVNNIVIDGTDVYVGGSFTLAGGITDTVYIAKWNGVVWTPLGKGCNASVGNLALCNGALYVSGSFIYVGNTVANDVTVNQIAKWQAGTWSSLGSGVPGGTSIATLASSGTDLYVGGNFTSLHVTTGYIGLAKLNTTNGVWSNPGQGLNGGTHSIVLVGSVIYAGGQSGSPELPNLIKIDGANRTIVGYADTNVVESMVLIGTDIYVGGTFTAIRATSGGPYTANTTGVARYNLDSSTWYSIGTPTGISTYSLAATSGGALYISLASTLVTAGQTTTNLLKFENSTLTRVVNSIAGASTSTNVIRAIKYHNGALYVGGTFKIAGGVYSSGIAKYSHGVWEGFGSGLDNGVVYAIEIIGDDLYIGGTFNSVNGVPASRIAKWSGGAWSALDSGCNSTVNALTAIGSSELYVGGAFTLAGGVDNTVKVAKWSGSAWAPLSTGISTGGDVLSLAASGSDLYVGGTFNSGVVKWSGGSWTALGSGCGSGGVYALTLSGTTLYVGGGFTLVGGGASNRIAKWDTTSIDNTGWSSVIANGGVSGGILYAIEVLNNNVLYLGGAFTSVAGTTAGKCAKWNGSTATALNMTGGTPIVYAIDSNSMGVYIGGVFTAAAGNSSFQLAWHGIS